MLRRLFSSFQKSARKETIPLLSLAPDIPYSTLNVSDEARENSSKDIVFEDETFSRQFLQGAVFFFNTVWPVTFVGWDCCELDFFKNLSP